MPNGLDKRTTDRMFCSEDPPAIYEMYRKMEPGRVYTMESAERETEMVHGRVGKLERLGWTSLDEMFWGEWVR